MAHALLTRNSKEPAMKKLIPTLFLAISFGQFATAYEMNQNSFVMVREALQKGPKPAMAD